MGPIWGRQDPGGPHIGPTNRAIWDMMTSWPWGLEYLKTSNIGPLYVQVTAELKEPIIFYIF